MTRTSERTTVTNEAVPTWRHTYQSGVRVRAVLADGRDPARALPHNEGVQFRLAHGDAASAPRLLAARLRRTSGAGT
jgi:hypothetical protein